MELNPERTLHEFEDNYKAYLNSPAERRDELAVSLRRSISRSEIELANLRDLDTDYEQRVLQKRLIGFVELAKQALPSNQGG